VEKDLDSLSALLVEKVTLDECYSKLDEGRPVLMDHLKDNGVTSPPIRQKFAKALAVSARERVGTGKPVLACLFSAGVDPTQGRGLHRPFIDAALKAGAIADAASDVFYCDHYIEKKFEDCDKYEKYIERIAAPIYASGRPVIVVGHSHGTIAGFGLASKLGPRCRIMFAVGRRPPTIELLSECFGAKTGAEMAEKPLPSVLESLTKSWRSKFLEAFLGKELERWPEAMKTTIANTRALYASRLALCAQEDIDAMGHASKPIAAPIVGVASMSEEPTGETAEKMESWAGLTSGGFELHRLQGVDHMDLIGFERTHPIVFDKIAALFPKPE
jgi:surfactin synthase thioesterase subunit